MGYTFSLRRTRRPRNGNAVELPAIPPLITLDEDCGYSWLTSTESPTTVPAVLKGVLSTLAPARTGKGEVLVLPNSNDDWLGDSFSVLRERFFCHQPIERLPMRLKNGATGAFSCLIYPGERLE